MKRCGRGLRVQTVLFDRAEFRTPASALSWARRHGMRASKVDTTSNYHRVRQESPTAFDRKSFRMVPFRSGVKAVVGCPKRRRRKR